MGLLLQVILMGIGLNPNFNNPQLVWGGEPLYLDPFGKPGSPSLVLGELILLKNGEGPLEGQPIAITAEAERIFVRTLNGRAYVVTKAKGIEAYISLNQKLKKPVQGQTVSLWDEFEILRDQKNWRWVALRENGTETPEVIKIDDFNRRTYQFSNVENYWSTPEYLIIADNPNQTLVVFDGSASFKYRLPIEKQKIKVESLKNGSFESVIGVFPMENGLYLVSTNQGTALVIDLESRETIMRKETHPIIGLEKSKVFLLDVDEELIKIESVENL